MKAARTVAAREVVARLAVPGWALALTALLLAPQRHAGYALGHDLVVTPQQPLNAATVGVSTAPARAVPVDFVVAVLEHMLSGGVVVGRLALAGPLLLAGIGAARLLTGAALSARLVTCGFAVWNPFVVERLALGQWALLWGYALLPWVLAAAIRWRRGGTPVLALVLPVAVASVTPTGGILAVGVVAAVVLGREWRRPIPPLAVAVALQLPWLVASALGSGATVSDPASVAAFAMRGEVGGVVTSALGLGGIWDAEVVPTSRTGPLAVLAVVVAVAAAVVGWRPLHARLGVGARGLAVAAAVGFVLAVASSVPGLDNVVRALITDVPGGGLLRDAQKWLAPLALLEALLLGVAFERLAARVGGAAILPALAVPLALLPDATKVVWPTVTPVHYPAGFAAAAHLVDDDVVVLPFQPYRRFAWAGGRPSLDPAARLLPVSVVANDRLLVGSTLLAGEDSRVPRVAAALASTEPARALASAGVGWVLVERRTPGAVPSLRGLTPVLSDSDVALFRVHGTVRDVHASATRVAIAAGVDVAWLATALGAAVATALRRRRRHRAEPAHDLERQPDR